MADYFCVVHRPGYAVPALRFLDSSRDEDTPAQLAVLIRDWPDTVSVDLFDGDRLVMTLSGADLAALADVRPLTPLQRLGDEIPGAVVIGKV